MPMRSDERLAERITEEILSCMREKSILDVGCGDGIVGDHIDSSCKYHGLDISDACIYEQRHDKSNVQYIGPNEIPDYMENNGCWDIILLLDVIEHTRQFTSLFESALKKANQEVIVSLPNELFFLDRLRMLFGRELNAHSLDRLKDPEGFKHQYIININKAALILNEAAQNHGFAMATEIRRPLISKKPMFKPALWALRHTTSAQMWSMGSIFIFKRNS